MKHITEYLSPFTLAILATLATGTAQAQNPWSVDDLSIARTNIALATVGDLVLYAGGNHGTTGYADVDIYDASSDTWSVTWLSTVRASAGGTAVGDLAFFAGGWSALGVVTDKVDILDTQSMTWSEAALTIPRAGVGATTVGTKAIFAGGSGAGFASNRVDIYDASTGLWSIGPPLSQARGAVTAVTVGDLAIFAGGAGVGGVPYDDVDIYNDSTGIWQTATLSEARLLGPNAAAVVGSRVYFGGGHFSTQGGPNMSDTVDVFDAQDWTWTVETLSVARGYVGVAAIGNKVLFAGGRETGNASSDLVEVLDAGTGTWDSPSMLSLARFGTCVATIGGKAMFAGGAGSGPMGGSVTSVIDVFEPLGLNYCASIPNSSGIAATISVMGSRDVLSNDLTLVAEGLPTGEFGFFLVSQTQGSISPAASQGTICLAGDIGRISAPGQVIQGPSGSVPLDLLTIPVNPAQAVQPGETWNFQCWYRDNNPSPTSNVTDAISVTFE